jgi:hypothetical protein
VRKYPMAPSVFANSFVAVSVMKGEGVALLVQTT